VGLSVRSIMDTADEDAEETEANDAASPVETDARPTTAIDDCMHSDDVDMSAHDNAPSKSISMRRLQGVLVYRH
jgi:hypothetical protein